MLVDAVGCQSTCASVSYATANLPMVVSYKGPALKRPDNDDGIGTHCREDFDEQGDIGGILV